MSLITAISITFVLYVDHCKPY